MTVPSAIRRERGWDITILRSDRLTVEVLPGRGATVLSIVDRTSGVDVLWRPRWGVPHRDAPDLPGSSEAVSMGRYPGGWSSLFPNAGAPSIEHGVEWPMHGEVWLAPFDGVADVSTWAGEIMLTRSPFRFAKRIAVEGGTVTVIETATNVGAEDVEVVWNQHPALGAPLIGPETTIESNARRVLGDVGDARLDPALANSSWPVHHPPAGPPTDLRRLPAARSGERRRAFLTGFPDDGAHAAVENPRLGLRVRLRWSATEFPYAWYWLEAGGRTGFPWYGDAYVLGIEPCTSYPTGGLGAIRRLSGTQVMIPAGTTATRSLAITVEDAR